MYDSIIGVVNFINMGRCKMKYTIFSAFAALVLCSLALTSPAVNTVEFEQASLIFEVNNTAKDIGVQLKFDGEPWNRVMVFNPDGELLADIEGKGNLKDLGLTENFFETNEPAFQGPDAETTINDYLSMFPKGKYELEGTTIDGATIVGTAELAHVLPCGPVITSPVGNPDPDNTVIAWNPVTTEINHESGDCENDPSPKINIIGYEVIVENEDTLLRVFDVLLPGTANSVTVAPEFLNLTPNTN
jgi:hypothetical protein